MSKRRAEAVARALERARKKMNDSGSHWIKRAMRQRRKNGMCYCALGGIYAATRPGPTRDAAVVALAREVSPRDVEAAEKNATYTILRLPNAAEIARRCERVITTWNDDPHRTWKQVEAALRRAAKKAAA